ncbi:MAG TPA: hypothetical protein VIJ64_04800 [Candidatus Lustribacter sp.]
MLERGTDIAQAILSIVDPDTWPIGSAHARRQAERYRISAHLAALAPVLDGRDDTAAGDFALRQRE